MTDLERLLNALPEDGTAIAWPDLQLLSALSDQRFTGALERAIRMELITTDDRGSSWRRDVSLLTRR